MIDSRLTRIRGLATEIKSIADELRDEMGTVVAYDLLQDIGNDQKATVNKVNVLEEM